MITKEQLHSLAKENKISETVIFREYLQLLFLSELYSKKEATKIFFKGGTALHLIYGALRFSEDLDFTVELEEKDFIGFISDFLKSLSKKESINFKERKTITGKKFLLTVSPGILPYKSFVSLDFSFREKVIEPQKSFLHTAFPVLFSSYVYHFSKEEILAEKIRALLTRAKGRDMYDLWFLFNQGVKLNGDLIKEKLKYYNLLDIDNTEILEKIKGFSKKDFVLDMRPFLPLYQRDKLPDFFDYLIDFLKKKLS
ncbi:MAG: nucleotidyl transferase AbiEii/AbiGii toxin family protein [Candidatus Kaelpia imicola]|nr:nucleotidyl transferase AbiEii/AbiGii toxin family protein [Candidatus Kaelpia imicola]